MRFDHCEHALYTRYVVQRWVDDIHIVIQVWLTGQYKGRAPIRIAEDIRNSIVKLYACEFAMKIEPHNEFVGIALTYDECHGVLTAPCSHLDFTAGSLNKVRFQHFYSNVVTGMKMKTVVGMIYQTIDRCLTETDAERALAKLFVEFYLAMYPWKCLQEAVRTVMLKHPYLSSLRRSFTFGMQIVDVYNRKRKI